MGKELGNVADLDCVQAVYSGILHIRQGAVLGHMCELHAQHTVGLCCKEREHGRHCAVVGAYMLLKEPVILLHVDLVEHTEPLQGYRHT